MFESDNSAAVVQSPLFFAITTVRVEFYDFKETKEFLCHYHGVKYLSGRKHDGHGKEEDD